MSFPIFIVAKYVILNIPSLPVDTFTLIMFTTKSFVTKRLRTSYKYYTKMHNLTG